MRLSETEKARRLELMKEWMRGERIDALLVVGDAPCVTSKEAGNFRYLTDFFVYASYSVLLCFAEKESVLFVPSVNPLYWAPRRSSVKDVRVSTDYASDIAKVLNEKTQVAHGRLGLASVASLPPKSFISLKEKLSNWEFIDADPIFFDLRFAKSKEEQRLLKKSAALVDASYEALKKKIKPGLKEYEIVGFLEGFHRSRGAEQTFNLISSGPFPGGKGQDFPTLPASPSDRTIKKGDVICLEISASIMGYWNQLVREVTIGRNPEFATFHKALVKTTRAGAESMKTGAKTSDFIAAMEKAATKEGFKLNPPMGHYVGLDLGEASLEKTLVLKSGSAAIVHPCLSDQRGTRVFWGETYLVGEKKAACLNRPSEDLVVI
jgi:Xaa-Pro aminopeptidase